MRPFQGRDAGPIPVSRSKLWIFNCESSHDIIKSVIYEWTIINIVRFYEKVTKKGGDFVLYVFSAYMKQTTQALDNNQKT